MRRSSRVATALAVLAAVALTAVGVWLSGRGSPPGVAQGEAQHVAGETPLPATPTPVAYPVPQPTQPHITALPTAPPVPTQTPFWNWPTPMRAEEPTPTAIPVPEPAADSHGSIWTLVQADSGRFLEHLRVGGDTRVTAVERLDPLIPASYWEGPILGHATPVRQYPSPGGQYLALAQHRFELDAVYIIELRSGKSWSLETAFTADELGHVQAFFCAWHPDESRVYLCDQEYGRIFLVDVRGGASRQYVSEALAAGGLAITPDGQQLAYATLPLGQTTWTLWYSRADGSEARKVIEGEAPLTVVSWSPEGDRLLILRGAELGLIDREGGNFRPLGVAYTGTWGLPLPRWSPDGVFIAYSEEVRVPEKSEEPTSRPGQEFEYMSTYVVDTRTGERRPLVEDGAVGDLHPAWSPDGQYVAFLSMRSGAAEIWLVDRHGAGLRTLTQTDETHGPPVWVPAQKGE